MHDPVTPQLHKPCDQQSPLDVLLSACLELTGTSLGNVQLMDWRTGHLRMATQRGFTADFVDHFRTVAVHDGTACGRAIRARSAVVVEDVQVDREFAPNRRFADEAGFRAVLSTPLISTSGAFIGVVSTHFPATHRPTDAEMGKMTAAAELAANGIIQTRARGDGSSMRNADRQRIERSVAAVESSYELLRRIERR